MPMGAQGSRRSPRATYDDRPLHAAYEAVPEIGKRWRWVCCRFG